MDRVYLVSFLFQKEFNNTTYGHSKIALEKGNYTEDELIDFFVESIKINFDLEEDRGVVITNIIDITKIRKELEE
jgi:hypothetical protein